jgi:formylglycine-generating enzyme required for sulfatase activity
MARFRQPWSGKAVLVVAVAAGLAAAARCKDARSAPAAAFKAYVETIPASKVQFEMVPIPEGTFLMGSPSAEAGRGADEGPRHPVDIQAFWMGKTEVTWDEYDRFWKTEGTGKKLEDEPDTKTADAVSRPTPPYADETFGHGREGHPVLCITHHAAMEYCRWLSEKTGRTYRLPTEAEWEYACRAGTKTAYFFGDDPRQVGDYAWYAANAEEETHEVGKKKPNAWGLHDMYGNVAEWCLDHYDPEFYAKCAANRLTLEPVLLPTSARFPHVARGGSWADDPARLRSAARRGSDKSWIQRDPQRPQSIWWLTDADFVGFRIVRPVIEQEKLRGLHSKVTRDSK